MKKYLFIPLALLLALALNLGTAPDCLAQSRTVSQSGRGITLAEAAAGMGWEMDRQLSARFGHEPGSINGITVIVTTPVDINNFEESSPVARQMQEQISHFLVSAGYSVQEIRRGRALLLRPETGELLLTRDKELAALKNADSSMVLVGTYTITSRNITFNLRLMQTGGSDVYAMSSVTLPLTGELRALASGYGAGGSGSGYLIEPSMFARLP